MVQDALLLRDHAAYEKAFSDGTGTLTIESMEGSDREEDVDAVVVAVAAKAQKKRKPR